MIPITQERVDEVKSIKDEIGWSWNTIGARLGWTPHQMRQVQALKIPIADEHIEWLLAVKAAIDAIPVPGPEVFMPQIPQQPDAPVVQDVKIMMLDDIAKSLVEEYFAIGDEATAEELAGARYMVGRLAERCGVADEVREAIRLRQVNVAPVKIMGTTMPSFVETDIVRSAMRDNLPPPPAIGAPILDTHLDTRPTVTNPFARRERVPMED